VIGGLGYFLLNVAQAIFLCAWTALWISLAVIVSIFHGEWPLAFARNFWGPGLVWASTARLSVEPLPPLEPDRAYVFVMNHQSMLDIAVAFAVIPRNLRFVAKAILRWVPFIGLYMWRTGMILVDRSNPKKAYESLGAAAERLKGGLAIIAYPEGTRTTDGYVRAFKKGPFVLAQRAGAAIVPVAIEGSWRVLPRGGFKLRPGPVRVKLGAPHFTDGLTPDDVPDLVKRVHAHLIELHRSIGGLGARAGEADEPAGLLDGLDGPVTGGRSADATSIG
jgi:1-acyl-sn-glycerol-3-phosphate acyltransferase